MRTFNSNWKRWCTVVIFAIAMAWVESAVVYDLRTLVKRIEPYQPNPLPFVGGLGPAELVRELATLVMLAMVGILAGQSWRQRLAYATLAFGIWDIFYYVFLRVICGWPHSLLDWDILFLLPLPWWGPVLAPVAIALLMVLWGTLASQESEEQNRSVESWPACLLAGIGMLLALYTFMADALRVAGQGAEAVRTQLPTHFLWPCFLLALALMAAPVLEQATRRRFICQVSHRSTRTVINSPGHSEFCRPPTHAGLEQQSVSPVKTKA